MDLLPSIAYELGITPKNKSMVALQPLLLGEQREDSFAYLYYNVSRNRRCKGQLELIDLPVGGTAESHEKLRYADGLSEPELCDLSMILVRSRIYFAGARAGGCDSACRRVDRIIS